MLRNFNSRLPQGRAGQGLARMDRLDMRLSSFFRIFQCVIGLGREGGP